MSISEYWWNTTFREKFQEKSSGRKLLQVSAGEWVVDLVSSWWRWTQVTKMLHICQGNCFCESSGNNFAKAKVLYCYGEVSFYFHFYISPFKMRCQLSASAGGLTFYGNEIKYLFASRKYSFHVSVCSSAHASQPWGGGRGISVVSWHWNARSIPAHPCCLLHPCHVIIKQRQGLIRPDTLLAATLNLCFPDWLFFSQSARGSQWSRGSWRRSW